jgi:hypothetical protein
MNEITKQVNYAKEIMDGKRCSYTLKNKNCRDCEIIGSKGWKCKEVKIWKKTA